MTDLRGVYVAKIDGYIPERDADGLALRNLIRVQMQDARRCGSPHAVIFVNGQKIGEIVDPALAA